jgi:ACR3 family arsenite transporter
LIWTEIAGGDNQYCAILVTINSILQMVLYAPMSIFFINIISDSKSDITVSYSTVAISVAVFLGIPLGAAIITRFAVQWIAGLDWYERVFLKYLSPWSLIGLLYTILVLFASQGRQVVHQIVSVVRVAAPLIVYFVVIFSATLWVSHHLGSVTNSRRLRVSLPQVTTSSSRLRWQWRLMALTAIRRSPPPLGL